MPTNVKAVLLIEQDGAPEIVERDMKRIAEICHEELAESVQIAGTNEEAENLTLCETSLPFLLWQG